MMADLTARPSENRYLRNTGQRSLTDHCAIELLLERLHFCAGSTREIGRYDVFSKGLQNSKASRSPPMNRRLDHPVTDPDRGRNREIFKKRPHGPQ